MRTRVSLFAATVVAALGWGIVSAADQTVRIEGTFDFVPNVRIFSTERFVPGRTGVRSGDTVTWTDATGVNHTVTIVNQADLPDTIPEVFGCALCEAAEVAHANGSVPVLNVGGAGLDNAGDSLWVPANASVAAIVSAPAGTTLYYLCAIHPWMQGSLRVT
jgi:plastocyanin